VVDYNSLTGPAFPDKWKELVNLKSLFVAGNLLVGPLPTWIDQLSSLLNIDLSFNFLTGMLPPALGNLQDLEGLAIDNNLFTGTLDFVFDSTVVPGLRNLQQFFCENNQFSGGLSSNFMLKMTNLAYLDVSDNKIEGPVPSHLFELSNLLVLDLHDNNFTSLPSTFPVNDNLWLLALQKCDFANIEVPSTISNLKNLTHLDLSQNRFTGEIPSTLKELAPKLNSLFLAQNKFSPGKIPEWLQKMTMLTELDLKSTQRTGTIPAFIGNLSQLVLLDLDNNKLTAQIPSELGNLASLIYLLLNRNELTGTIPPLGSSVGK